jgi:hypothetical protein
LSVCLNWGSTDSDEGGEDSKYDSELHCCVGIGGQKKEKTRRRLEGLGRLSENKQVEPLYTVYY